MIARWLFLPRVISLIFFILSVDLALCVPHPAQRQDCIQKEIASLTTGTPLKDLPSWENLPENYSVYRPQGTMCSDGSPFYLLVTKRSAENLVVFYEGGGACFDYDTCCGPNKTFTSSVGVDVSFAASIACGLSPPPSLISSGVFEQVDTNPFLNYSFIYATYCTGDIWAGNANATYSQSGFSCNIHHVGTGNGRIVTDWILQSWTGTLKKVVVMGRSAGGYGAMFHGAALAKGLEDASADVQVSIFSDSALGAATPPSSWRLGNGIIGDLSLPRGFLDFSLSPPVNVSSTLISMRTLIGKISEYFACARVTEFTRDADENQAFFYGVSNAVAFPDVCPNASCASLWTIFVAPSLKLTKSIAGNLYAALVAPGTVHTIIGNNSIYTEKGIVFGEESAGSIPVIQFVEQDVIGNGSVCQPPSPSSKPREPTATPSESLPPSESSSQTLPPENVPFSPSPTDSSGDGACFPGDALVSISGRGMVPIADARIGDLMLSSGGNYAEIYFFSHYEPFVPSDFVELTLSSDGTKPLHLSPTHFLPLGPSNDLVQAKEVKVGDLLLDANRTFKSVKSVRYVRKVGLVVPHLLGTSEIVVDGVICSTWTAAVPPPLGRALLTPLETFYRIFGTGFIFRRPQVALHIARSVSLVHSAL